MVSNSLFTVLGNWQLVIAKVLDKSPLFKASRYENKNPQVKGVLVETCGIYFEFAVSFTPLQIANINYYYNSCSMMQNRTSEVSVPALNIYAMHVTHVDNQV